MQAWESKMFLVNQKNFLIFKVISKYLIPEALCLGMSQRKEVHGPRGVNPRSNPLTFKDEIGGAHGHSVTKHKQQSSAQSWTPEMQSQHSLPRDRRIKSCSPQPFWCQDPSTHLKIIMWVIELYLSYHKLKNFKMQEHTFQHPSEGFYTHRPLGFWENPLYTHV